MPCCQPPDGPTAAGFLDFVRNQMGVPTQALPDNSPYLTYAYDIAVELVNIALAQVSCPIYTLAVYNMGGSNLVNFAPDQPDAPNIPGTDPPVPYFAAIRQKWKIFNFVAGVISGSSDVSTSQTLLVPDAFKNLTIADLQYLKDPWGRQYLAFAQKYGPDAWGVS